MTLRHGTRYRYSIGCRCDDCAEAARIYQRAYRLRKLGAPILESQNTVDDPDSGPGPVEIAVSEEIDGLASQARPGLAAAALAIARVLDNPRAVNQQPAAAKVLISMLEKLRSASPAGRRGLAVVREMTKKGGT